MSISVYLSFSVSSTFLSIKDKWRDIVLPYVHFPNPNPEPNRNLTKHDAP